MEHNEVEKQERVCKQCGTPAEGEHKFCQTCGAALEEQQEQTLTTTEEKTETSAPVAAAQLQDPQNNQKPAKAFPKAWKWAGILAGATLLFVIVVSQICVHKWVDATCTDSMYCSVCGEEKGEPLGHNWTEATCTSPKTCLTCEETSGSALGHTVNEWTTTLEPTCSEKGQKQGTCVTCSKVLTESIDKLAHTEGEWKVTKEATASAEGEKTLSCKVCGQEMETKTYKLSAKEIKNQYIKKCKTYSYSKISRNPDDYDGKYAKFTGEVIQVQQEKLYGIMFYTLRVNVTKGRYYYTDTIYVTYTADEDDARILEDDIVTMYGKLTGEKTYTTVMGASVTIPSFSAEYIDIK